MFILTFLFINNPEKNYHSLKNIKQHNCFQHWW